MICGRLSKIFVLALLLLVLVLSPTYSLDSAEAEELTEILSELNSGLTKIESGLNEISSGQENLEKELNGLSMKTKELETELIEQKKAQMRLETRLKNLSDSYKETERMNKWLTIGAASATGLAVAAMAIAVLN